MAQFIGPLDSWDTFFIDRYCKGERPTGAEHSWLRWTNHLKDEGRAEDILNLAWIIQSGFFPAVGKSPEKKYHLKR